MIKKLITKILIIIFISLPIFSQNLVSQNSSFKHYNITEFKSGMRFIVESNVISTYTNMIQKYHEKGKGKKINLIDFKGEIFTFRRYESRKIKSKELEPKIVLIFAHKGNEYEYFTSKTINELKNDNSKNIKGLVFFENVEIAKKRFKGKQYHLIKNLGNGENRLCKIVDVKPYSSDFPIQIQYTYRGINRIYELEFRISKNNKLQLCDDVLEKCSFSDYFIDENEYQNRQIKYLNKKKLEKDLVIAYKKFELKEKPNKISDVIEFINKNDTLKFLDYQNDYLKFEKNEKIGYVKSNEVYVALKYNMIRYIDSLKILEKTNTRKNNLINDCNYKTNKIDEFDGLKKKYTTVYNIVDQSFGASNFSISLRKIGNQRYIKFYTNFELGCSTNNINRQSYVKIKLVNGDILTFNNIADLNCRDFSIYSTLSLSEMARLKKSPIKTVRLEGTEFYRDIDKVKWNMFFKDKLECIE